MVLARRLFLIAALIALSLQIVAPIGAIAAIAARTADPLANLAICSDFGQDGSGKSGEVPGSAEHAHAGCVLCQIASPTGLAARAASDALVFPIDTAAATYWLLDRLALPRGPPFDPPEPRGPPIHS